MTATQKLFAWLIGSGLIVALVITLWVKNEGKGTAIEKLTEDWVKATNEVQALTDQLAKAQTNHTTLFGQAKAIETERNDLVAEKTQLIADQATALQGVTNAFSGKVATLEQEKADLVAENAKLILGQARLLQGVTNAFSGQVATLEQEKTALAKERDLLDQRSSTLFTLRTDLAKQIFALTNTTARTRTSSGGVQINLIQTPGGLGSAKSSFTTNGVVGGVPALFVNKAEQTVIMTVRGNGVTFTLDLKAKNGVKRFDILPGEYNYNYTVGDDPTLLPEGGSATFTVDKESSHFLEGFGAFNGGAIFRGKQ